MRKVFALLLVLGFFLAVSGIAFAGGFGGTCSYSKHVKQVADNKANPETKDAAKTAQSEAEKLLLAQAKKMQQQTATPQK